MPKYQDTLQRGDFLPTRRVSAINPDHIKIMALIFRDPNPIHFDKTAVTRAGLGNSEVNQGGTTMAYVIDLLAQWTGSRAAVKRVSCRFRANVFAGDELEVGGQVTDVRYEGDVRLVDCEIWVDQSVGTRVISGDATVCLEA